CSHSYSPTSPISPLSLHDALRIWNQGAPQSRRIRLRATSPLHGEEKVYVPWNCSLARRAYSPPLAVSSACVPCSTTWPPSITTIDRKSTRLNSSHVKI